MLLGFDVGSSFVKASLLDIDTGKGIASATSPETEMPILAPYPGWAEQQPELWWEHVVETTRVLRSKVSGGLSSVQAIGISYQMHGLVLVNGNHEVLRPSIIWCDSRSVRIGDEASVIIGEKNCLERFLNLPGNFTASKLKWVMENEPAIYEKTHKAMLPGDYIAMRMTGEVRTTPSGLSEAILWDHSDQGPAGRMLDAFGISGELVPDTVPTFSVQGELMKNAAKELGLEPGVKISYRAGDQPNNALSLNVLEPGEAAATAGTSGVIYGVADEPIYDAKSRVNTFVHVNHSPACPRYGVLLCINGCGIMNSWARKQLFGPPGERLGYEQINELARKVPIGSEGIVILPYGNGAERTLENREMGASVHGLNFNTHTREHLMRAVQEGVVFALNHGLSIMRGMGIEVNAVRAGRANMFLSPLFCEAFANTTGATVELYNTDGALGAARGAGFGAGIFATHAEAFRGLDAVHVIEPDPKTACRYQEAYLGWVELLNSSSVTLEKGELSASHTNS